MKTYFNKLFYSSQY